MSDLKIYNNGENKVLMSAGDRIIKQPYEFGNAFVGTSPYSIDINVPSIDYSNFTLSIFTFRSPQITTNDYVAELFLDGVSAHSIKCQSAAHFWAATSSATANSPGIAGGGGVGVNRFDCISIASDALTKQAMIVSGNTFYKVSYNPGGAFDTYITGKVLTKIKLGFYALYSSAGDRYNKLSVFNRRLTDSELLFLNANGNGSKLQSREGIVLDIIFNSAEILDFSALQDGSDLRVGCRDYSGFNRHGQIINLPVGSLQDQLIFANTNLFVPFMQ